MGSSTLTGEALFETTQAFSDVRYTALERLLGQGVIAQALDDTQREGERRAREGIDPLATMASSHGGQPTPYALVAAAQCAFDERAEETFGKVHGYWLNATEICPGRLSLTRVEAAGDEDDLSTETDLCVQLVVGALVISKTQRIFAAGPESPLPVDASDEAILAAAAEQLAHVVQLLRKRPPILTTGL